MQQLTDAASALFGSHKNAVQASVQRVDGGLEVGCFRRFIKIVFKLC